MGQLKLEGRRLPLLRAINAYRASHFRGPATRTLCELVDLASTSNISYYLRDLAAHGLIAFERTGPSRQIDMSTLRLTEAGLAALARSDETEGG